MRHLYLVQPPTDRRNLYTFARQGVLYAARRLRALGITDPEVATDLTSAAMADLMDGTHARHAHEGGPGAFRLLCVAIDRLIDCGAEQTEKNAR